LKIFWPRTISNEEFYRQTNRQHSASFPCGKRNEMEMDMSYPKNVIRFHSKGCNKMDFTRKKKDRMTKRDMALNKRKKGAGLDRSNSGPKTDSSGELW
jgi:hypothetical protein